MVPPDFRAISSGQLSLGIAEPSNYNFILEFQIDKILVLFAQAGTALSIIGGIGTNDVETVASAVRTG
jgi:hypothetical protein